MNRIKQDKLELLKALLEHVDESLENVEVNDALESEVEEMLIAMKDRKRVKQLKNIRKELNKWISEWPKSPRESLGQQRRADAYSNMQMHAAD